MVNHVAFIWNIAESLRGPFKPSEYGSVVLPFTVLRRLDAVLADTKPAVLEAAKGIESLPEMLQTIKLNGSRQRPATSRRCFCGAMPGSGRATRRLRWPISRPRSG